MKNWEKEKRGRGGKTWEGALTGGKKSVTTGAGFLGFFLSFLGDLGAPESRSSAVCSWPGACSAARLPALVSVAVAGARVDGGKVGVTGAEQGDMDTTGTGTAAIDSVPAKSRSAWPCRYARLPESKSGPPHRID